MFIRQRNYLWDDTIIVATILAFTNFWSFTAIPVQVYKIFEIACLGIVTTMTIHRGLLRKWGTIPFSKSICLLIVIPLLSVFSAFLVHGQSPLLGLYMFRYETTLVFYYFLHVTQYPPRRLILILTVFGAIWALLLIVQQFTYPYYFFAQRGDDYFAGKSIEMRNGVYRYMTTGFALALIPLYYSWTKIFEISSKQRLPYVLLFTIILAGFYVLMTRQLLVAILLALAMGGFLNGTRIMRILSGGAILTIIAVISLNVELLFGEMVDQTANQIYYNVRYDAYRFFLLEYWRHPLCLVLGNGMDHSSSAYGAEIAYYQWNEGMHRSDVGLVGAFSLYGIFYIIVCFWVGLGIIVRLKWKFDFYFMYFFTWLLLSAMIFPIRGGYLALAFSVCLYLFCLDRRSDGFGRYERKL